MSATQLELAPEQPGQVSDLSGGILAVIERAARDPNTDVEKMERLFAMHERVLARTAEQQFNEAMVAAQRDMPQIKRGGKNETTRSTYAELDALSEAMSPIIAKHGFAMSYGTDVSPLEGHYRITCEVSHAGGHSKPYFADVPADLTGMKGTQNKTNTHAFGSTLSYGRRYLKMLIFDVATTDDDGRAASSGERIDDSQIVTLQGLANAGNADMVKFCRYFKISSLPELPAREFANAFALLSRKVAK
jgi:hypothetical protein